MSILLPFLPFFHSRGVVQMKIIASGLSFAEAPRWHEGRLYFSDFYQHRVLAMNEAGELDTIVTVPGQPSGLGWLPDGRLLVVSMLDRKLMRLEPDGRLVVHADLGELATWHCNDMVVDAQGRAWVGNFGSDIEGGEAPVPANLMRVDVDGSVSLAAADLKFPNGSVITPDGSTLIVAETFGRRLTAFDMDKQGELQNRREWANTAPHFPDGICLDAEGAIWIADPVGCCVVRVGAGGEILQKIDTGRPAFACVLGGADNKQLYVCTADGAGSVAEAGLTGCIEVVSVAVAGAVAP
jgi:sugar lactone lactonase YvrE